MPQIECCIYHVLKMITESDEEDITYTLAGTVNLSGFPISYKLYTPLMTVIQGGHTLAVLMCQ